MKKLYIAPFDCSILIYKKDELEKFERAYSLKVTNEIGVCSGNGVWIGEHENITGVCYHEAVHLADWVIEDRLCMRQATLDSNTELRAYLTEYIGNAVVKYIMT